MLGIAGIVIFPWKLVDNPNSFVYKWLIASSSLLGSVTGVMICDYFILRHKQLVVDQLYNPQGIYSYYRGWNFKALIASILSIVPNVPGFLAVVSSASYPEALVRLYDYAWFISFGLSFLLYWMINWLTKTKYQLLLKVAVVIMNAQILVSLIICEYMKYWKNLTPLQKAERELINQLVCVHV